MMTKLNDILPSGSFNGFLKAMGNDAPWMQGDHAADADDVARLDLLYLYDHSGDKWTVPLMQMFLDSDGKLDQSGINQAAAMALSLWKKKWENLWAVHTAEYDPIKNYDMTEYEKTTPSGTETTTDAMTGTDTKRTQGTAANNETETAVYGFNSSNPVPASVTNQKSDYSEGTTFGHTNTNTKSFTNRKTERELTRSGNIGVTTSQQMLQSSIELSRWNFWLQVFEDLDTTFCLDCY